MLAKNTTRQYKNIFRQSLFFADYSKQPGLGIRIWVRFLSGKYPPRSCFQANKCPFLCGFRGVITVKSCFKTKQSPDPPGRCKKTDYSPRFPLLRPHCCSRFPVRSSTESTADDWLPGAPHWHQSLIPPSNRKWSGKEGGISPCEHRQQVEVWCDFCYRSIRWQTHRWTSEGALFDWSRQTAECVLIITLLSWQHLMIYSFIWKHIWVIVLLYIILLCVISKYQL